VKQVSQWAQQSRRERTQPKTWRRWLEKKIWTTGLKYSWRKMEVAAQDRGRRRKVVCGLCSNGSEKGVSQVSEVEQLRRVKRSTDTYVVLWTSSPVISIINHLH